MLEFVNELLDSQNNIIDQLLLLKTKKDHQEVQIYINTLIKMNNSPFFKYCIDKYYFEKEVLEVDVPIPVLKPIYNTNDKVGKLLEKKDNLIDQIKLLKKNYQDIEVKKYVENYMKKSPIYIKYCLKKYYYDLDVKEVKPSVKTLGISLYKIYIEKDCKNES